MRRLRRAVKALLENMDQQHAQILKHLRSGQGDKKNKSKQVEQPVPCKHHPLQVPQGTVPCTEMSCLTGLEARDLCAPAVGWRGLAKQ